MIADDFAGGGSSSSSRKRHYRNINSVSYLPPHSQPTITFSDSDFLINDPNQDDPMVVTATIANWRVHKVLIDQWSSMDVLYWPTFKKLKIPESTSQAYSEPLLGFAGQKVHSRGFIDLLTTFGRGHAYRTLTVRYILVDADTAYNVLIGRRTLNQVGAVVSTPHMAMKFPASNGEIITVKADPKEARQCYMQSLRVVPYTLRTTNEGQVAQVVAKPSPDKTKCNNVESAPISDSTSKSQEYEEIDLDLRAEFEENRPTFDEPLTTITVGADRLHTTRIGLASSQEVREELERVLLANADLFAWSPEDMSGIDPDFMCHRLALLPQVKPVPQRKRKMGEKRRTAIESEVSQFARVGFIRKVIYTTWLANVVMVKKGSSKWRICVDYTDLNKACSKDTYLLPNIDRLVDGTSGHKMLSFLDAYSGYNQIWMYPPDEEAKTFMTEQSNFCYRVMSFGLKNVGVTYQRLMDKIFNDLLGKTMEVYVDDMVVKSQKAEHHPADLETVLARVRKHDLRLNPDKCVFGVGGGKFLGFMITLKGIEANPDKCEAILGMRSPACVKEVQQLNGKLAALSRFLPKLAKKARPLFKLLKGAKTFEWDTTCESMFQQIKKDLSTLPVLVSPLLQTPLLIYLVIAQTAISAVLVYEQGREQSPVYFTSRTLQPAEERYQVLEKLVLTLVFSARRLRHYFRSHQLTVKTDYLIKQILQKPELAERMTAWAIELSKFGLRYEARSPMKAQFLAEFLTELPPVAEEKIVWLLSIDSSSNKRGSGAGIILEGPGEVAVEKSIRFGFDTSNNQAEYEALIAGLRLARDLGVKNLRCQTDSQLIAGQMNGDYQAREPLLQRYYHVARNLTLHFNEANIVHVPRAENDRADVLSKLASTKKVGQHRTLMQEVLYAPSWNQEDVFEIRNGGENWMTPILNFLVHDTLPENEAEARKVRRQATSYTVVGGELFRRGFSIPLLKCLDPTQAEYVLAELHRRICGMHSGTRSMAIRALRAGYYWPTIKKDAQNFTKKCQECQRFGAVFNAPPEEIHQICSPWPFSRSGVDILGTFPLAKGQVKFLIVVVDYFTKWIEAEPIATITAHKVQNFLWKHVICRHGLPHSVVTDNGRQFTDRHFEQFFKGLGIKHLVTTVEHPQTNGQAEAANKVILSELKKRLGQLKGLWAEEIPNVLWGYHCTPQSSTKETPYRLTYGTDVMIPVELGEASWRREHFDEQSNNDNLRADLDMVQEVLEEARIRAKAAKLRAARRYNTRVRRRTFQKEDLVWRKVGEARRERQEGKFAANWDGPYRVIDAFGNGAYKLEELGGKPVPRTWNATHLKMHYS